MIRQILEAFLRDCKSRELSPHTVEYYRRQIQFFQAFCHSQGVERIEDITADLLRQFLISLDEKHNAGGKHAKYRAVKVFLLWYEREMEPEGWKNPIHKVKAPKVPDRPIVLVTMEEVQALLGTCENTFVGLRDNALLKFWLDTGARVGESMKILLKDVDLYTGTVLIREGKGGKPRSVYLGRKSLRALRKYLRQRTDNDPHLWVTSVGTPLAKRSAQAMLERRAGLAGIDHKSAHKFRKAFSTIMSQKVDVFTLSALTGDTIEVLDKHYVEKRDDTTNDAYHRKGSPVDDLM